jgi:predicted RNA polymerase sigma factor
VLQASIAALQSHPDPDRAAIVALYDRLAALTPSPAVLVNRAAAVALASGAAAGLAATDRVQPAPGDHRLLVLRAELQFQLGREADAAATMRAALAAAGNDVERRHLQDRLDSWTAASGC